MKTNKNQLKEVSQILELEDNKVLIELYGQHDENLTKIENNFGIHISYCSLSYLHSMYVALDDLKYLKIS